MNIRNRHGAMSLGWALGIIVAVVGTGFIALRTEVGQTLFGGWSFVRSIAQDEGTYYRLKVKLTYKGEPQDFDIVVGCNVRRITYKDGSGTYEAGLIPTVFGRRMTDGKGLVVRPPNACQGETTANGRVRRELMPIVVVYDNADTLDFGTAYISDDAYESPLSVLTFSGATIETATRTDFESFRQTQANLVSRESYWSALAADDVLKRMNISRAAAPWAHVCEGYERFRIPEAARSVVRAHWPDPHPDYWIAANSQIRHQVVDAFYSLQPDRLIATDREGDIPRPVTAFRWPWDDAADFGAMRRAPTPGGVLAASFYPSSNDYRFDKWPIDRQKWPGYIAAQSTLADVAITFARTHARGLAYCFVRVFPDRDLLAKIQDKRVAARIDATDVVYPGETFGSPPGETPPWIFERDEYGFLFFRINLESTRGDV